MKKRLVSIIIALAICCSNISAFAMDQKAVFTEVKYYTAKIYVCDTQNNAAILLNVTPLNGNYNLSAVKDIEYRALPVSSGRIVGTKGQKLSMEVVNGYLLDSPVRVMIGKNGYGYRILYMELLR